MWSSPPGLPRVWCVPLNCHWKGQEGSLTTFNPNVKIGGAPALYCEKEVASSLFYHLDEEYAGRRQAAILF